MIDKKRSISFAAVILIALFAFHRHEPALASMPSDPPATIFGQKVAVQKVSDSLSYPARVISRVSSVILAETDGVVNAIPVRLGDRVHIHQNLMTLRHSDPIFEFKPLLSEAPVSGVISSIDVTEGTQVTRGQRLASITDPEKLRVVIEVPAEDRMVLRPGFIGQFRFGSGHAMNVRLQNVGPSIDAITGTATCEFDMTPAVAKELSIGMIGQISITTNQRSAIEIPQYAVIYRKQMPFVRIYEEGKIHFAAVTLGKKHGETVEILEGVKPGDYIVQRASRFVADGEQVQIEPTVRAGSS